MAYDSNESFLKAHYLYPLQIIARHDSNLRKRQKNTREQDLGFYNHYFVHLQTSP